VLTECEEAQTRLVHLADAFLHHDRPIVRPADDPVYRVIAGVPRPLRLGRGSAPLELELPTRLNEPVLALGSHMKNTLCLAWGKRAVVSPHIGELDTVRSLDTFAQVAADLQRLYQVKATAASSTTTPATATAASPATAGCRCSRCGITMPTPRHWRGSFRR
jgi:hydrogenase maturation protein HypF